MGKCRMRSYQPKSVFVRPLAAVFVLLLLANVYSASNVAPVEEEERGARIAVVNKVKSLCQANTEKGFREIEEIFRSEPFRCSDSAVPEPHVRSAVLDVLAASGTPQAAEEIVSLAKWYLTFISGERASLAYRRSRDCQFTLSAIFRVLGESDTPPVMSLLEQVWQSDEITYLFPVRISAARCSLSIQLRRLGDVPPNAEVQFLLSQLQIRPEHESKTSVPGRLKPWIVTREAVRIMVTQFGISALPAVMEALEKARKDGMFPLRETLLQFAVDCWRSPGSRETETIRQAWKESFFRELELYLAEQNGEPAPCTIRYAIAGRLWTMAGGGDADVAKLIGYTKARSQQRNRDTLERGRQATLLLRNELEKLQLGTPTREDALRWDGLKKAEEEGLTPDPGLPVEILRESDNPGLLKYAVEALILEARRTPTGEQWTPEFVELILRAGGKGERPTLPLMCGKLLSLLPDELVIPSCLTGLRDARDSSILLTCLRVTSIKQETDLLKLVPPVLLRGDENVKQEARRVAESFGITSYRKTDLEICKDIHSLLKDAEQ